jgi:hypothetical protein
VSEQQGDQREEQDERQGVAALAPAQETVEAAAPVVRPAARIAKAPRKAIASRVQEESVEAKLARTKRSHRNRGSSPVPMARGGRAKTQAARAQPGRGAARASPRSAVCCTSFKPSDHALVLDQEDSRHYLDLESLR